MKKLANISQFESLMNTRATVDNGRLSNYLGGKLIKHYLLNGHKAINPKNFYVAEKEGERCRQWFSEMMDDIKKKAEEISKETGNRYHNLELVPEAIKRGFMQFGMYCANLKLDISDLINTVQTHLFISGRSGSNQDTNTITITVEDLAKDGPSTVAHELIHLLDKYPEVNKSVRDKISFPWRMGTIEGTDGIHDKDRIRAWLAGDEYTGKETRFKDGSSGSEYLPMLPLLQKDKKLPFLYAVDVLRLIKKINKATTKQVN